MGRKSKKTILEEKIIEHEGVIANILEDESFDNEEITEDDFFALFQDKVKKREFYKKVNSTESNKVTIRKNLMISALIRKSNIVTQASNLIGINPATHYEWLKNDEEYAKKVAELDNYVFDFVEGKMLQTIDNGDAGTIRWYLSTKAKSRGYGDPEKTAVPNETIAQQHSFFLDSFSGETTNWLFFKFLEFTRHRSKMVMVCRGGTRSGKTYEFCQFLIYQSYNDQSERYLITRISKPALDGGAKTDIQNIIQKFGITDFKSTQKPCVFTNEKTKTEIHLQAYQTTDQAHGHKYKYIGMDEAPFQPFGVFQQLEMRCHGKVFLIFNPTNPESWVNQEVEISRQAIQKDVEVVVSTYKDNKFLEEKIVKSIEFYASQNENYRRVYAEGEYGVAENLIYPNWSLISDAEFYSIPAQHTFYGVDWGFHPDPTAVVCCRYDSRKNNLYVKELSVFWGEDEYAKKAVESLQSFKLYSPSQYVFCDSAEPASIQILQNQGVNALKAIKQRKDGVRTVQQTNIFITDQSENIRKEISTYSNKIKSDGTILSEPADGDDHTLDAIRYAVHTYLMRANIRLNL